MSQALVQNVHASSSMGVCVYIHLLHDSWANLSVRMWSSSGFGFWAGQFRYGPAMTVSVCIAASTRWCDICLRAQRIYVNPARVVHSRRTGFGYRTEHISLVGTSQPPANHHQSALSKYTQFKDWHHAITCNQQGRDVRATELHQAAKSSHELDTECFGG